MRKTRLDRAHNRRELSDGPSRASIGAFLYPALLAADVLALRATDVLLQRDQESALEIMREIGRSFNRRWRAVFPLPHMRRPTPPMVRGVDGRKMSTGYRNELPVFWHDDRELETRVMHMVTGSTALGDPVDPDACAVFELYQLLVDRDSAALMGDGLRRGQLGYREAKRMLLSALREYFQPYQERRRRLEADPAVIEDVLKAGARRVREEVETTLDAVRESVGLGAERRRFI
jgi:tryptophanyl-tRNA synthetase